MAKLWDKYLVTRRDGTVPDWPYFVLSAADPAAPVALRKYAKICDYLGMDEEYVTDILNLAFSFEQWRAAHTTGDPDAGPHRVDDPTIVSQIKAGSTPDGWKVGKDV